MTHQSPLVAESTSSTRHVDSFSAVVLMIALLDTLIWWCNCRTRKRDVMSMKEHMDLLLVLWTLNNNNSYKDDNAVYRVWQLVQCIQWLRAVNTWSDISGLLIDRQSHNYIHFSVLFSNTVNLSIMLVINNVMTIKDGKRKVMARNEWQHTVWVTREGKRDYNPRSWLCI